MHNKQCPARVAWLMFLLISGTIVEMSMSAKASVQLGCEIRATRNDARTRLDAVITGSGPVSGTYSFKVRKRAGDEVTSETGNFEIKSSTPSEIKKAGIDLEHGDGYEALLTIDWPNGSSSCSAAVS
jgi:hypothetical protein